MSFINLENLPEKEVVPGFFGKFIHTKHNTIVYWRILAGSNLPEHQHPHEQVVNLISGEFEFTLEGEKQKLTAGSTVVVPAHVPHAGTALSDCFIIDIFYPVREDYR